VYCNNHGAWGVAEWLHRGVAKCPTSGCSGEGRGEGKGREQYAIFMLSIFLPKVNVPQCCPKLIGPLLSRDCCSRLHSRHLFLFSHPIFSSIVPHHFSSSIPASASTAAVDADAYNITRPLLTECCVCNKHFIRYDGVLN
jgi:hypothetical protein